MSLYNMLFGRNPASRLLLAMLNLTEADVGRFRDCYLARGDTRVDGAVAQAEAAEGKKPEGELRIVVYTRNGGGNRDDYEDVTSALQALPEYITDYDDDFDCTYASYEFKVPEKFKETASELAGLGAEPNESPMERFKSLIAKLQAGDQTDPSVQKAMQVGKEIFESVAKAQADGTNKVEV